jgi:hypothetical protein
MAHDEAGCAPVRQALPLREPHGSFLPWIEAEFEMSQRTAYNFISVA